MSVRWCSAVVALVLMAGCGDDGGDGRQAAREAIDGVEFIVVPPYEHFQVGTPITYERTPPVGGDHWFSPGVAPCGFHEEQLEDALAVHSLEHGAVWIAFDPALADDVAAIRAIADENERVLASPREELRAPVVLSAWGAQLELPGVDDERLEAFVDAFVDSDAAPEAGAGC